MVYAPIRPDRSLPPVRINLFSDTQTRPSAGMKDAMMRAEVGDEQNGDDPTVNALCDRMAALTVPTLILTGDEDWPCLQPALLMKQTIPAAALAVMPNCGHAINIEDPDEFNRIVGAFLAQVDAGRWPQRDPRAMTDSITGIKD